MNTRRDLFQDYKNGLIPKLKVADLNDDPEIIARLKHVLRKNEKLGSFYSRTSLGRSQILQMSRDEISRFVAQAEINATDSMAGTPDFFDPKPLPLRFSIAVSE